MSEHKDGGPAFPAERHESLGKATVNDGHGPTEVDHYGLVQYPGMSLRDYFAARLQADDRLVKAVRAMDDADLAVFAASPDAEHDEALADADYSGLDMVERHVKRFSVEARAIARVRYMQADAMLAEREK